MENQIEIYQGRDGHNQLEVRFEQETVWLTNNQAIEVFDSSKANVSEHIKPIFQSKELEEGSTVRKFRTFQKEGERHVTRQRVHYSLDVIIAIVYRINTKCGTQISQWATQRLKGNLVQGYDINEKRLQQKQLEVQTLIDGICILSLAIEEKKGDSHLEWLNQFAKGLELLDDYGHENLKGKSRLYIQIYKNTKKWLKP